MPEVRRLSDESAAGVQVGNDVDQPGDGGDLRQRRRAERAVVVAQPRPCDVDVAVGERIERAIQAEEEDRQLVGFAGRIELV